VSLFSQLRKVLKSITYQYCEALQKVEILQTLQLFFTLFFLPTSAILVFLPPTKDRIIASIGSILAATDTWVQRFPFRGPIRCGEILVPRWASNPITSSSPGMV
jgi:hypothetical protein